MELLFFSAFGMSIAFAAQPGVIAFEALRRGLARGWRAALHLEIGSLVGDATWALIALIGASVLFQNKIIALILSLFGGYLLLRFAFDAWKASRAEVQAQVGATDHRGDFTAGAMLSLSNPQNLTFWLGMSGTVIGLGFLDPQPAELATFFVGFMIAQVCWCFFFAGLVGWGRRFINQRFFRSVNAACALLLAVLGANVLFETARLALAV
jgi:chemosensory pili system protein ChpE